MNVVLDKVFCRGCGAIISDHDEVEFDLTKLEDKLAINEIRSHLGLKALNYEAVLTGGDLVPVEDLFYVTPNAKKDKMRVECPDKRQRYIECVEVDQKVLLEEITRRIESKNKILKHDGYVIKVKAVRPDVKVIDGKVHVLCPICGNVLVVMG